MEKSLENKLLLELKNIKNDKFKNFNTQKPKNFKKSYNKASNQKGQNRNYNQN